MNKIARLLTLSFLSFYWSGCQTTQPENVQLITQIAVSTGAGLWLKDHAEDKPKFEAARDALKVIVDAGQGTPDQLAAALSKMPITVVGSPPVTSSGTVKVVERVTRVKSAAGKEVAVVNPGDVISDWVLPIARGAYYGLNSVLGK